MDQLIDISLQVQSDPYDILQMSEYPDILNELPNKKIMLVFEVLAAMNNPNLVNKKGQLGGFTALHW